MATNFISVCLSCQGGFQAHRVGWLPWSTTFAFMSSLLFQAHRVGWRRRQEHRRCLGDPSSKPTAWDGDHSVLNNSPFLRLSSKPTAWDGDLVQKIAEYLGYSEFQAHRVGWRSFLAFSRSNALMGSKPTAWDGDFRSNEFKLLSPHGSKPTVWDGDFTTYIISFLLPGTPFQAHRVGW